MACLAHHQLRAFGTKLAMDKGDRQNQSPSEYRPISLASDSIVVCPALLPVRRMPGMPRLRQPVPERGFDVARVQPAHDVFQGGVLQQQAWLGSGRDRR